MSAPQRIRHLYNSNLDSGQRNEAKRVLRLAEHDGHSEDHRGATLNEAGGHVRGELSTMALVPAVVDALPGLPVLAAGGLSDGRGVAAALMLGADAAVCGTAFLGAAEANVHTVYRAEVQAATGADTRHSTLYNVGWPGAPGRTLVNSTWRAWEAAGRPAPGFRPGDGEIIARGPDGTTIERYQATTPRSELTGEVEAMPLWAGQGVGLVTQTRPAAEIVADLVSGAQSAMARFQS
jgi:nitronate monooxygenase